jgi:arylsulfatase A
LPYSNDMWPKHPTAKNFPPLPLIAGEKILEHDPDQTQLTRWYSERAVKFIETHKDEPFFVYLPHSMPHVPLFASEAFRGKTERGLFGDVISEIDAGVGQILAALKKHNLDEKTLVIFASDNGPWLSYGDHAGSAGPLREGKGTSFEGGVRVPFVARFPGQIPAGHVCREPAMTIDVLPTLAKRIGAKLAEERRIDGLDVWPLVTGKPEAKTPHDALYFYWGGGLEAIRSGAWKLHFPHAYRSMDGKPGGTGGTPAAYAQAKTDLALFNLENDVGEKTNVIEQHPEVAARLKELAERAREDLGDSLTKRPGKYVRPAGRLQESTPDKK